MRLALVIALPLIFLGSCQSGEENPDASKEPEEPSPIHPWDWVPDSADLTAGKVIYQNECSLCHDEGEEGAPSLANRAEWETRSAKDLETLLDHAINGFQGPDGKMPARGGTRTLTDEEVTNAVKFMLAAPK